MVGIWVVVALCWLWLEGRFGPLGVRGDVEHVVGTGVQMSCRRLGWGFAFGALFHVSFKVRQTKDSLSLTFGYHLHLVFFV